MPAISEIQAGGPDAACGFDLMPNLCGKVDELCWLRAMHTDSPAIPARSASSRPARCSSCARPWVPGLSTVWARRIKTCRGSSLSAPMLYGDDGSPLHYSNVFLPAIYQGTRIGDARTPVKESKIGYLGDPSCRPELQRQHLDLIQARNRLDQEQSGEDRNIEGLIQSYELAFRMQMRRPDVFDV